MRIECQAMSRTRPSEMRTSQKCMGIGEFQWDPVLSRKRQALRQALSSFPTVEDVLKLAADKILKKADACKLREYLEMVRKVVIINVTWGQPLENLWVTVECSSLRILEDLWEDYCSKILSECARDTPVTQDILEKLGLTSVKLKITISEEEYKGCRVQFLKNLGVYDSLFHLYTWKN